MERLPLFFTALLLVPPTSSALGAPLECSLAGAPDGRIAIRITNTEGRVFTHDVYPALTLEPVLPGTDHYWAPVDLDTGEPYGPNQPRHLSLQPGHTHRVVVTPTGLSWDRSISSVWPDRAFAEVVPDGPYFLRLDLSADCAESKGLPVAVEEARLLTRPSGAMGGAAEQEAAPAEGRKEGTP